MSFIDEEDEYKQPRERELTLSMGTILGIFFGLVLLCGLFFGFGYNMGSRTRQTAQGADPGANSGTNASFGSFSKPSAGSFNASSSGRGSTTTAAAAMQHAPATTTASVATPGVQPAPLQSQTSVDEPTERVPPRPQPVSIPNPMAATAPASHTAAAPAVSAASSATAGPGSIMVQVAAVSHQEDAQLLVGALRTRGYTVAAHTSPTDSFYHVQVGPFSNKKDAEAMRQKLLGDGYNAVLK